MTEALALIVGTGFERLGLAVLTRSPTKTPFGAPSGPVLTVEIAGRRVACIARHGERHELAPHEVNYRANVWALRERGARECIGVNAVGAIARDFAPGELAVPDQLVDYTYGRASTYGGEGRPIVHVDFTEPFALALRARLAAAVTAAGHGTRAGVYGVTQGPRLETAAEIDRLERDGCTMVGMTAMPEAALARELDLDYAVCAVAVNHAAGRHPSRVPIHAELEASLETGMRRVADVLARVVRHPDPPETERML